MVQISRAVLPEEEFYDMAANKERTEMKQTGSQEEDECVVYIKRIRMDEIGHESFHNDA